MILRREDDSIFWVRLIHTIIDLLAKSTEAQSATVCILDSTRENGLTYFRTFPWLWYFTCSRRTRWCSLIIHNYGKCNCIGDFMSLRNDSIDASERTSNGVSKAIPGSRRRIRRRVDLLVSPKS